MLIVDAHLDLAYNALRGRDVLRPAAEQRPDEEGTPSVGLPDLRVGQVGLICATIFCEPSLNDKPGYRTADEAHAMAIAQLEWYRRQFQEGQMRRIDWREQIGEVEHVAVGPSPQPARGQSPNPLASPGVPGEGGRAAPLPTILLLEGADAIRTPADVSLFFDAGVRIVGLAWRGTRYAGGTRAPGPLTPDGVQLVKALDVAGIIHDVSHLAEESFWQLMDLSPGPVIASHSNCRSIVPTDRQLSDEMIRAIVRRDGIIGINFLDYFLMPPPEHGKRRATLADLIPHIRRICDLAGDANHVGLGTDMDGGIGAERLPSEIRTSADLPRVADALASASFSDDNIRAILGYNWLGFFRQTLPRAPVGG